MNTFLKILGLAFLALLALHFAPVLCVPVILLALAVLATGLLLAGGAILVTVVVLAVVAGLAPIWLPVALVVGLIVLIRRRRHRTA
ncbi:MAG: hypothetical protein ACHQ5A_08760 [Opitutales bacterium]